MHFNFIEGEVLYFDKSLYWTSFDLVNKVRFLITKIVGKKIKVGHAGTLDPLATGLVIICTGKKTKEIDTFQDFEKEYIATVKIGSTTPSFDLETNIDFEYQTEHINEELIKSVVQSFTGEQEQIPPSFSAKKIDGKRAYLKARQGIDIEIKPSKIKISYIEVLNFDFPNITIKIGCSKGTYVRALARDIGLRLNSGAHLVKLQRTKIGVHNISKAISIDDFENIIKDLHNKSTT